MRNHITIARPKWIIIIPVLIFLFFVSLDGVNRYTIRRDELTTLGHIGALFEKPTPVPISYTLQSLTTYSSDHAPLYYVLINIWGGAFEFNYFALRILSVWFGIIAIAGTYWLGRRLSDHNTGLFAALLLGTNVLFYGNVHEMRDWTMLVMLSVLIWMSYWHVVHKRKPPHLGDYFVLFALTAISLYTSFLIIFLWVTIGLYHLLAVKRDRRWWMVSIAVIAGGVIFLPWLPEFIKGLELAQNYIDKDNPMLLNNLLLIQISATLWGNGQVVVFMGLIGLALYASWKNWETARPIVFFFVLMISGLLIVNELFHFLKRVRYLVYLTVPFSLFVGYGLAMLTRYRVSRYITFIVPIIWFVMGYQYTYTDEFNGHLAKDRVVRYPEYSELIPIIKDKMQKRDLFIQANYNFSIIRESKQDFNSITNYYMDDMKLKLVNFPLYVQWEESGIDATPVEYATGLIPQYEYFWFNYHHNRVTDEIIEFQTIVEENYSICETIDYGDRSRLVQYVLTDKLAEHCITQSLKGT